MNAKETKKALEALVDAVDRARFLDASKVARDLLVEDWDPHDMELLRVVHAAGVLIGNVDDDGSIGSERTILGNWLSCELLEDLEDLRDGDEA